MTGQGLGGGLLGLSFDRALSNPVWLRERVANVEAGRGLRAKDWGKAALAPLKLHVRWRECNDASSARELEAKCLSLLKDAGLWNH